MNIIFERFERFVDQNLNGILGTIVFHLILIVIFLAIRINALKVPEDFQMEITFEELPEDFKTLEERQLETYEREEAVLPQDIQRNIARNVAKKYEEELSTEKYEQQLKQELNIEDYQMPDISDEALFGAEKQDEEDRINKDEKKIYQGSTTITYYLENRHDLYISIPVYKCEGGGKIILEIEVNQKGRVINASVLKSDVTDMTDCLVESAISAAYKSFFNQDLSAVPRQKGTITYQFIAQ